MRVDLEREGRGRIRVREKETGGTAFVSRLTGLEVHFR